MPEDTIYIANDHGGYELKLEILKHLKDRGYEGGRHAISLGLIAEAEEKLCNPGGWEPAGPVP